MPALLTRMWSPPNRSCAASIIALTSAAFETSTFRLRASAPSAAATRSPPAASQSAINTRAPSATNFAAMPAPKPEPPPVTIAILPSSLMSIPSCRSPAISVGEQIVEGLAGLPPVGTKVALVRGQDTAVTEMLGQQHQRSIGQIHRQFRVAPHH